MKRILITGGAGFLGSHLVDQFLLRGYFVYCLDNLSTGSLANVANHLQNPSFLFLKKDVQEMIDLPVDAILNFACPASPPSYQKNPVDTLKTSFLGAMNLLELAKKRKIPFFQASTSEVYGDPAVHPQPEHYWGHVNPIGLRSCYDEGKRSAETLSFDYARTFGVQIKVVRIFNTYGPRMDPSDGRVISNFIVQAIQNLPITLYGDGSQTRSFCYVDDLIRGILAFFDTSPSIQGPINLGNPVEYSVKQLADEVLRLTNSSSQITFCPLPSDDPRQRRPDTSKAKALLHWEPTYPLEEGLRKTIAYFRTRLAAPVNLPQ